MPFSSLAAERGRALNPTRPPHYYHRVAVKYQSNRLAFTLRYETRHNSRAVPEVHRPFSRSRKRLLSTLLRGSLGRRRSQKSAPSLRLGGRTSPSRVSFAMYPMPSRVASMGNNRATGRPLSVTTTSSPAFAQARYSLRDVFSLDTVAVFICYLRNPSI